MSRPKLEDLFPLPPEAKKLEVFLGNWSAAGALTFMGKPFKLTGSAKFTSAAAGWGVFSEVKLEIENLGLYDEVDLLAFDRDAKTYHFFAVTNTGAAYDHKGKWVDDGALRFFYEGNQGGKRYIEELEVRVQNPNEIVICENDSLEGSTVTTMNVTLRRT